MKNTVNFTLEGVQGKLEYTYSSFKQELRQDGRVVERKGNLSPKFYIMNTSGEKEEIKVYQGLDFVPTVTFRGQKTRLAERLSAIEYLIGSLPILLVFFGGAIGGMCGFVGASINYGYMQSEKNRMKQIGVSVVVSVLSYLVYLVIALFVQGLLG